MAIRTTALAVNGLLEVDASISSITPYLTTASVLVDRVEAAGVAAEEELTAAELEIIERWLSAHFISIRAPQVASEAAGPVSASYQHSVGMHLDGTMFGQQALLLDSTGYLAKLNQQAKGKLAAVPTRIASVSWLGTEDT